AIASAFGELSSRSRRVTRPALPARHRPAPRGSRDQAGDDEEEGARRGGRRRSVVRRDEREGEGAVAAEVEELIRLEGCARRHLVAVAKVEARAVDRHERGVAPIAWERVEGLRATAAEERIVGPPANEERSEERVVHAVLHDAEERAG